MGHQAPLPALVVAPAPAPAPVPGPVPGPVQGPRPVEVALVLVAALHFAALLAVAVVILHPWDRARKQDIWNALGHNRSKVSGT